MLACYHEQWGDAAVVKVGQIPLPRPLRSGEVLVKVHASSFNPADFKIRGGQQRALLRFDWPRVFGFDFSGTVVGVGRQPSRATAIYSPNADLSHHETGALVVGDNVFGMVAGVRTGGMAEYLIVDMDLCAKKPPSTPHREAASLPLVAITAISAFRKCGLKSDVPIPNVVGPRVLITGGSGGVGTVAIQLARRLFHASYVAVTASAASAELCTSLGADRVVDYRAGDFVAALRSGERFDAILDCTGDAARCCDLLRRDGGMVSILASPTSECLREWICRSRAKGTMVSVVHGFLRFGGGGILNVVTGAWGLRRRCAAQGARFDHVIGTGDGIVMADVANLLACGQLRAVIDRSFALEDAAAALAFLETGRAKGKVVVEVVRE
jgi:NADPH:quinone reductase-like Zn-dependent oxidoreductase